MHEHQAIALCSVPPEIQHQAFCLKDGSLNVEIFCMREEQRVTWAATYCIQTFNIFPFSISRLTLSWCCTGGFMSWTYLACYLKWICCLEPSLHTLYCYFFPPVKSFAIHILTFCLFYRRLSSFFFVWESLVVFILFILLVSQKEGIHKMCLTCHVSAENGFILLSVTEFVIWCTDNWS